MDGWKTTIIYIYINGAFFRGCSNFCWGVTVVRCFFFGEILDVWWLMVVEVSGICVKFDGLSVTSFNNVMGITLSGA